MMKWIALLLAGAGMLHAQKSFNTGQAARVLIGQPYFNAQDPGVPVTNSDGTITTPAAANRLGGVSGLAVAGDKLMVVDANKLGSTPNNNRVLIYNNISSVIPPLDVELPPSDARCPFCVGVADLVLGQADFTQTVIARAAANNTVRSPAGVASDGKMLAVADTDYNRVLVWKSIPTSNGQAADIVLGQPDMASTKPATTPTGLRGPQGVWFDAQGGLWVADTSNNRVVYYGVPASSGQAATLVLGEPDLNTNQQPRFSTDKPIVRANTMQGPVSVTTDGTHLFVSDLGLNRILIWNTIPRSNGQDADVVVGQLSMFLANANSVRELCDSTGTDPADSTKLLYPDRCARTMAFPRFALSDGRRLFVSDGGNDRIMVFNSIPTENGAKADVILGQVDEFGNQSSDTNNAEQVSSANSFRTPNALALFGRDLFVADTYNRRVLVYTEADYNLPVSAVRNLASPNVYAIGTVLFGGTVTTGEAVTISIGTDATATPIDYKYTIVAGDTFETLVNQFVSLINAGTGDPNVYATPDASVQTLILSARQAGEQGNSVTQTTKVDPVAGSASGAVSSTTALVSNANLQGGQNAARIAPFTLVSINGLNLSDQTLSADVTQPLPWELGGVQVYVDGIRAPILAVAPNQVKAQIPVQVQNPTDPLTPPAAFAVSPTGSSNVEVRTVRNDGSITVTTAANIPIIEENPGIFAADGDEPRAALAYHYSDSATATVSVDGTVVAGDTATVLIDNRAYTYTVVTGDDAGTVRNALVQQISANDPQVDAFVSGTFTRIRLKARIPGPEGNGIPISTKTTGTGVILTAFNNQTCCANVAGAPVTLDNPAIPGETIILYATGLGIVKPPETQAAMINGQPYAGNILNEPLAFVAALVGTKTANVLFDGLKQGAVGIYEVQIELNGSLPTDPKSQATLAQGFQVSNIVTIPVVNPSQN
jgi:uncharacterized protein (TIGR03437 family)